MSQETRTVAVTGASGFIGRRLVEYFSGKDWMVRAFQRKLVDSRTKNITYHKYSLQEPLSEEDFIGVACLVHCAFQEYNPRQRDSDEVNIEGTRRLIDICRKNRIKLIFLSTLSAHEKAESHYGINKLEIERFFDQGNDVVLRLGLVLGRGGLFGNIVDMIKSSRIIPLIDNGSQPIQTLMLEELCGTIEKIVLYDLAGKYNLATPQVYKMKDLYLEIMNLLQLKRHFLPVKLGLVMFVINTIEKLGIPFGINSENVLGLKNMRAFDTADDLRKLNIEVLSLEESIERLL